MKGIPVAAVLVAAWLAGASSAHAVLVSAGTATGLAGDIAVDSGVTFQFVDASSPSGSGYDGAIHVRLDLGSVSAVHKILNVNRTNVFTLLNALTANIYVAPDESDPGFDTNDPSDYTTLVFSGAFTPAVATAGTVREADLGSVINRRFFLIDYTANFLGTIDGVLTNNTDRVQVGDLQVTAVPEPLSAVLLGLGPMLVALRRRSAGADEVS